MVVKLTGRCRRGVGGSGFRMLLHLNGLGASRAQQVDTAAVPNNRTLHHSTDPEKAPTLNIHNPRGMVTERPI